VKCIFAVILVLIIFKHTNYTIRKNCVDLCARHGRGAIEICQKRGREPEKIGKHWLRPKNKHIQCKWYWFKEACMLPDVPKNFLWYYTCEDKVSNWNGFVLQ